MAREGRDVEFVTRVFFGFCWISFVEVNENVGVEKNVSHIFVLDILDSYFPFVCR